LKNILTIDLENWYHPEYVRREGFTGGEDRVAESLGKTLRLLDECDVNATFFVVGEIVERHPELLEEIGEGGHEVAFHGYYHAPLWELDAETLRLEIDRFNLLTNEKCVGFRAPSFSLSNETRWALKVLEDAGFLYDSSIFPSWTPLYGVSDAPMRPYRPSFEDVTREDANTGLWEFPLLVYSLLGFRVPVAGGFFLRLFPTYLLKRAIRKVNRLGFPAVTYVHNWELDPETPRLRLGAYASFVTYHNLGETRRKLRRILGLFPFTSFRDYLGEQGLSDT
jgi:polysaccharide deacetylase family protein (PEP-CTERM system associated)